MPRKTLFLTALLTLALHAQAQKYIATWASSQQTPEPTNELSTADLTDTTLRQIVHLSAGGATLRVRVSNAFGRQPIHLTEVHIARALKPGTSAIDPATDHALTFAGNPDVLIPAAAEYWSDPVEFNAPALSDLAITLHLDTPPQGQTGHPGSHTTSFLVHGDALAAPSFDTPKTIEHWYFLSGVDVATESKHPQTLVILGDSITDGHGSTTDGNNRWPDFLAQRLQADKHFHDTGVVNQGIGGNHMLTDGLGPNALARFDRDVLAQSSVTTLFVLEGINDLGYIALSPPAVSAEALNQHLAQLEASYTQVVARAHAHGIRVIGATVLPYLGSDYYHPSAADEAKRQALNTWIRTPGRFDALVDFDRLTTDPTHPGHLLPAYDSGDHLHPSPAGYKAMANAINLTLLK